MDTFSSKRTLLGFRSLAYFLLFGLSAVATKAKESNGNPGTNRSKNTPFPYALSSTYLSYLAHSEQDIYREIKEYTRQLEERLVLAKKYLRDYEDSTLKGTRSIPDTVDSWEKAVTSVTHPIIAYRMIRRFAEDFADLGSHVNKDLEISLQEKMNEYSGRYGFPSRNDVSDAMEGMLRLHYVYALDTDQFASGNIMGVETPIGLTAKQTFGLADYAVRNEYYTLAYDWLRTTESKIEAAANDKDSLDSREVSAFQVANLYTQLQRQHDKNFDENWKEGHTYIYTEPIRSSSPRRMQNMTTVRDSNINRFYGVKDPNVSGAGHYNFLALCNGLDYQAQEEKNKLYCWLDTKRNPYFYINPLRLEWLSQDPFLLQIYDIVPSKWISEMRRAALPTIQRAPPPNYAGATPRTAIYAWLEDEHIPNTPISRLIELITGLHVRGLDASEALQIASYAYGGHVSTHYDSLGYNKDDPVIEWKGDRVTTFLVYLNEVTKGGFTAFPIIGAHVEPVRGSAVLWYTALKNGSIDSRMLHGACPVVLGHKWIATKWTHLNKNFLTRPCSLNNEE